MATLGARIRRARLARGLTQQELAKAVDRTRVAISEWERDISRPRENIVPLLARVLRVPESSMTPFGSGGVVPVDSAQRGSTIPMISWEHLPRVAKGAQPVELATQFFPVQIDVSHEDEFAVQVVDNSMAPEFSAGDTIVINQSVEPSDGCYVVVQLDGDDAAMLRRYTLRRGRAIDLIPDSPDYPIVTLSPDRTATIIGVVVSHTRSLRPVPAI